MPVAELLTDASRALDANASPLSGALWYFYATGTTTPQAVYTTAALNVAHANPVVADAGGKFAPIYFDSELSYRGILKTAAGAPVQDIDPINLALATEFASRVSIEDLASTASGTGAALVGFSHSSTYPSSTLGKALQHIGVSIADAPWNALGDGSDETAKVSSFFTHAKNNPGTPHYLEAGKVYGVSSPLPDLNVSSVKICGGGSEIHDVGSLITGTVLRWIGGSYTAAPMLKITSISGASNARVSNIDFKGIGIDCANGALRYGLELLSIQECDIDVTVANAGSGGWGVSMSVVASLGEARDPQRNKLRINGRQVEGGGFVLSLGGDSGANASMNEFWIDCQHYDTQAIYCANSDNNNWRWVRCYHVGGGAATESISLLGGATQGVSSRGELFDFLSLTLPIHVYGTTGSPSFAYPSKRNVVKAPDFENGFPAPIVEEGGEIEVHGLWQSYTPTWGASGGAAPTIAGGYEARWSRMGNLVRGYLTFQVTAIGGGGTLRISLPFPPKTTQRFPAVGQDVSASIALAGRYNPAGPYLEVARYDSTTALVAGNFLTVQFEYEVPS